MTFDAAFFESIGIDATSARQCAEAFERHKIRADVASSLTLELLRDVGVAAVGDRLRIWRAVCASAASTSASPAASPAASSATTLSQKLAQSCDAIRGRVGRRSARVAIVLGSGLGALAHELSDAQHVEFGAIPHFPVATAQSHSGKLLFGRLRGVDVMLLQGRVHLYEGYGAAHVVYPVQVMRALGAETLLLTNACGGINRAFAAGDVVLLTNQLNLMFQNPLVGPNDDAVGVRWPHLKVGRAGRSAARLVLFARQLARALADQRRLGGFRRSRSATPPWRCFGRRARRCASRCAKAFTPACWARREVGASDLFEAAEFV